MKQVRSSFLQSRPFLQRIAEFRKYSCSLIPCVPLHASVKAPLSLVPSSPFSPTPHEPLWQQGHLPCPWQASFQEFSLFAKMTKPQCLTVTLLSLETLPNPGDIGATLRHLTRYLLGANTMQGPHGLCQSCLGPGREAW